MDVPFWWKRKKFVLQKKVSWYSESVLGTQVFCTHLCQASHYGANSGALMRPGVEWRERITLLRGQQKPKEVSGKGEVMKDPGGEKMGRWESVLLKSQFLCIKHAASGTPCLQSLCLTPKLRHRPLFPFVLRSPPNLPSCLCTRLFSTVTLSDVFTPSKCLLFLIKTE